jgi:hypothetical protein
VSEEKMVTIQERTRALVKDDVTARKVVDVYRVAEMLRLEFPDQTLKEIVDSVSKFVVGAGGSAYWHKSTNL